MINYSISVHSTTPGTKKDDIKETKAYGVAQISEIMTQTQIKRKSVNKKRFVQISFYEVLLGRNLN